jgi:hypothetical protein
LSAERAREEVWDWKSLNALREWHSLVTWNPRGRPRIVTCLSGETCVRVVPFLPGYGVCGNQGLGVHSLILLVLGFSRKVWQKVIRTNRRLLSLIMSILTKEFIWKTRGEDRLIYMPKMSQCYFLLYTFLKNLSKKQFKLFSHFSFLFFSFFFFFWCD